MLGVRSASLYCDGETKGATIFVLILSLFQLSTD